MQAVGLKQFSFFVRYILKRSVLFILLAFGLAAIVLAQGTNNNSQNPRNRPAPETVTVSGSLVVARGFPALKSGDVTYFVGGLNRLTGFIDGLKEGAQVTIEGQSFTNPRDNTVKFLRPTKMTLNGKSYDMAAPLPPAGSKQHAPRGMMHRPNQPFAPQWRQNRPL